MFAVAKFSQFQYVDLRAGPVVWHIKRTHSRLSLNSLLFLFQVELKTQSKGNFFQPGNNLIGIRHCPPSVFCIPTTIRNFPDQAAEFSIIGKNQPQSAGRCLDNEEFILVCLYFCSFSSDGIPIGKAKRTHKLHIGLPFGHFYKDSPSGHFNTNPCVKKQFRLVFILFHINLIL